MKKTIFIALLLCISVAISAQGTQVGSSAFYYSSTTSGNIGGLSNGSLNVRHLNGKAVGSTLADNLYLNFNTAKHVYVGGGTLKSDLIVNGNLKLTSYAYQEFNVGNTKAYIWGNHNYAGASGNFADDLVISANWQGVDSNTDNFKSSASFLKNGAISVGRQGIRLFTSDNATSAPSQRVTILPTGLVGIGTTTPAYKLHVVETAANTPVALFENTNAAFATGDLFTIKGQGGPTTGSSLFRVVRGSNTAMHIRWDGKVGIGTTTPGEKLEVNGNALIQGEVYSTKIKVSTNPGGWPDYVFEKNYSLTPLNELENYLKTNKHLPEVPSAKEVETNGQDLGDIQAILLKKVEELILYMIEQNKKQVSLEERLKTLEEENKQLKGQVNKLKK